MLRVILLERDLHRPYSRTVSDIGLHCPTDTSCQQPMTVAVQMGGCPFQRAAIPSVLVRRPTKNMSMSTISLSSHGTQASKKTYSRTVSASHFRYCSVTSLLVPRCSIVFHQTYLLRFQKNPHTLHLTRLAFYIRLVNLDSAFTRYSPRVSFVVASKPSYHAHGFFDYRASGASCPGRTGRLTSKRLPRWNSHYCHHFSHYYHAVCP